MILFLGLIILASATNVVEQKWNWFGSQAGKHTDCSEVPFPGLGYLVPGKNSTPAIKYYLQCHIYG